ncbi:glycosyltransferase [Proteus cibi]|uniref:glycosyltransferase n=2 Tax=Proteus TaxID=583 RepID=UPI000D68B528|nr:glycosyltransferase [Proteus cibi]
MKKQNNVDIYFRTPRQWIKNLAIKLGCNYSKEKTKQMFEKKGLKEKILDFSKSIPWLPPLEWLIPYHLLTSIPNNTQLIVETGSKLILTKKNHIVYVECGIGLFSYNTKKINKINLFFFKNLIKKKNFKGFVFYSEASKESTKQIFIQAKIEKSFEDINLGVIYPYSSTENIIISNNTFISTSPPIKLLFCSSSFKLKGGREVIQAFEDLKHLDLELYLVTNEEIINNLSTKNFKNIKLIPFGLSTNEYLELINSIDIIIHPTYFDTHALSLLEAIKLKKPSIATNTFAISEYIIDGITGILIENRYHPYSDSKNPNFSGKALDYAKKIERMDINSHLIEDIKKAIEILYSNIDSFNENCLNERKPELNDEYILEQWEAIFKKTQ